MEPKIMTESKFKAFFTKELYKAFNEAETLGIDQKVVKFVLHVVQRKIDSCSDDADICCCLSAVNAAMADLYNAAGLMPDVSEDLFRIIDLISGVVTSARAINVVSDTQAAYELLPDNKKRVIDEYIRYISSWAGDRVARSTKQIIEAVANYGDASYAAVEQAARYFISDCVNRCDIRDIFIDGLDCFCEPVGETPAPTKESKEAWDAFVNSFKRINVKYCNERDKDKLLAMFVSASEGPYGLDLATAIRGFHSMKPWRSISGADNSRRWRRAFSYLCKSRGYSYAG